MRLTACVYWLRSCWNTDGQVSRHRLRPPWLSGALCITSPSCSNQSFVTHPTYMTIPKLSSRISQMNYTLDLEFLSHNFGSALDFVLFSLYSYFSRSERSLNFGIMSSSFDGIGHNQTNTYVSYSVLLYIRVADINLFIQCLGEYQK